MIGVPVRNIVLQLSRTRREKKTHTQFDISHLATGPVSVAVTQSDRDDSIHTESLCFGTR